MTSRFDLGSRYQRTLAALLALGIIALAVPVTTDWLKSGPEVTKANCARLRIGMTVTDADAILGANHRLPPAFTEADPLTSVIQWRGGNGDNVVVWFDEGRTTVQFMWRPSPDTLWTRIWRWCLRVQ